MIYSRLSASKTNVLLQIPCHLNRLRYRHAGLAGKRYNKGESCLPFNVFARDWPNCGFLSFSLSGLRKSEAFVDQQYLSSLSVARRTCGQTTPHLDRQTTLPPG